MPFKFLSKLSFRKSTGKEKKDEKYIKKPRAYDEVDINTTESGNGNQQVKKKPRAYDEVDVKTEGNQSGVKVEDENKDPPLNYIEVDIKPSSGLPKIVNNEEHKTGYSTIDFEATQKLANENKET